MNISETETELDRLRNRHVRLILEHLGSDNVPPYLAIAIKKQFTMFKDDVLDYLISTEAAKCPSSK
jgi:hypothetical protein